MSNLTDRFWAKVDRRDPDECWLFKGAISSSGYGSIKVGGRRGRTILAHRLAYELTHGPLPQIDLEGNRVLVCHRCDTPRCCNPAHLRAGTQADNLAEMAVRRRSRAILSGADAATIREWYPAGWRQVDLAAAFGVSRRVIGRILRGEVLADA